MSERPRFHLAIPVDDLAAARGFYGTLLGCPEGRSAERWVDFDFQGHQLVCHQVAPQSDKADCGSNRVDGEEIPVPHFGLVLTLTGWRALADRLRTQGARFTIEPTIRFAGQPGEQGTFFLRDPSGNLMEFKGFADIDRELFRT